MKASEIMTSPAITVTPQTPVAEIAALLTERRVSAVPVVEGGRLVGVVSEADLLHRAEIGTDGAGRSGWAWLGWLIHGHPAADYVRTHAFQARDVMTRKVYSAPADAALEEIVALMEKRRIKRVPVLRGGELVGIVSRSDVIRALAARLNAPKAQSADDEAIRARLEAELETQPWWRVHFCSLRVVDGVVHYVGMIGSEDERAAARVAAENVPGVRAVEDHRFTLYDAPAMV